jgi:hypothetical protein
MRERDGVLMNLAERQLNAELKERSREVAALAAEVQRLRMALGAVRIVNNGTSWSSDKREELGAICDLALEPDQEGSPWMPGAGSGPVPDKEHWKAHEGC